MRNLGQVTSRGGEARAPSDALDLPVEHRVVGGGQRCPGRPEAALATRTARFPAGHRCRRADSSRWGPTLPSNPPITFSSSLQQRPFPFPPVPSSRSTSKDCATRRSAGVVAPRGTARSARTRRAATGARRSAAARRFAPRCPTRAGYRVDPSVRLGRDLSHRSWIDQAPRVSDANTWLSNAPL